MLNIDLIKPIIPTEQEKAHYAKIMVDAVLPLRAAWELAKEVGSNPNLRFKLFRQAVLTELDHWKGEDSITVEGVTIQPVDLLKLRRLITNRDRIIQSVSALILERSRFWAKRLRSQGFDPNGEALSEFYGEGVLKAIDCIYSYDKPQMAQFVTYFYRAMENRFRSLGSRYGASAGISENDSEIRQKFNHERRLAEQELDANGKPRGSVSFDEVVARMGMDVKQATLMFRLMSHTLTASQMDSSLDGDPSDDYTGMRRNAVDMTDVVDSEQLEALRRVELTDWEKAVLRAFSQAPRGSSSGWRTKVALSFVKEDGTRYSRAAPTIALERIIKKVQTVYEEILKAA